MCRGEMTLLLVDGIRKCWSDLTDNSVLSNIRLLRRLKTRLVSSKVPLRLLDWRLAAFIWRMRRSVYRIYVYWEKANIEYVALPLLPLSGYDDLKHKMVTLGARRHIRGVSGDRRTEG
jgi:hypothetical protein